MRHYRAHPAVCSRPDRHGGSCPRAGGSDRDVGTDLPRRSGGTNPRPRRWRLCRSPHQRRHAAARRQLGCLAAHAARAPVQATPFDLRVPRRGQSPHLGRSERQDAVNDQAPHPYSVAGATARHLDGWSSTPAGIRCAYVAGIFNGPMGRQRAGREDDAPQGGVDSPQRVAHHRPGDDDRALHPARELPHARVHD